MDEKEYQKLYYQKNKAKKLQYQKEYEKNNYDLLKPKKQIYKKEYNKKYNSKYYQKNTDTLKAKRKIYEEKNTSTIKEKKKQYYIDNKDYFTKKNKEYRIKNKLDTNEKQKAKRKIDELFRLSQNMRSMLCRVFRRNGYSKYTKTATILGCSFEELKEHLESQFKPWMSWDNYGLYNGNTNYGWDIDHIQPISSATTEIELHQLNHYSNLQPLCSHINRDVKRDG